MRYRSKHSKEFREKFEGWATSASCLGKDGKINQSEAGRVSGLERPRVVRIIAEDWVPPPEIVRAFIEQFDLPREEWLEAAGYSATEPRRAEVLADELIEISTRLMDIARELIQKEKSE